MPRPAMVDDHDAAAPDRGAGTGTHRAPPRGRAAWLRLGAAGVVAAAMLIGIVLFAYQLAIARIPQHRATLERLVRAHTGLELRFNELGLRWGWYGPEAVFQRVELGEPGRSNVLLRASELTVGIDAWRTMQSGQLQAGRITLVAPDINFARLRPHATQTDAGRAAEGSFWNRAELLRRWPRGRVEVEGGTLTVPHPAGTGQSLSLQIRRVSLRRIDDTWSASGDVLLPERLGRTARVSLRLKGDPQKLDALRGSLQLEGRHLVFGAWRELLQSESATTQYMPFAGTGDIVAGLAVKDGRVVGAEGELRADGVAFRRTIASAADHVLDLGYLSGDWKAVRRVRSWHVTVEDLEFGMDGGEAPGTALSLDVGHGSVDGKLDAAPLRSVVAAAQWLAPDLDFRDARLDGVARDLAFDWAAARSPGERLQVSAEVNDLGVHLPSVGFALAGMQGRLYGSESALAADLEGSGVRLELAHAPDLELGELSAAARLRLTRSGVGWQLATERLAMERGDSKLSVSGELSMQASAAGPSIDVRGTLVRMDAMLLKALLGAEAQALFGATAQRLSGGHIESAELTMRGALAELPFGPGAHAFSGSLVLREASLEGNETWPRVQNLDAELKWQGPDLQLSVARGTGGPFELTGLEAAWRADGERSSARVHGEARGTLQDISLWLLANPRLREYAPHVPSLAARGPVLLDVEVSIPPARNGRPARSPRVKIAAAIEEASLQVAPLPPLESVHGTLRFDSGRLQRTTLAATWLGGPATLQVTEHGGTRAGGLSVEARGMLDAQQFAAAVGLAPVRGLTGRTHWEGALTFAPAADGQPALWQARADTTLTGIESALPPPFAKPPGAPAALRVELEGTGDTAVLRVALSESVRSVFALVPEKEGDWRIDRGTLHFGRGTPQLPNQRFINMRGRMPRLDLPAWLGAWRSLERDPEALPVHADLAIDELLVAGRSYEDVAVAVRRDEGGFVLHVDSQALAGMIRWPSNDREDQTVEARFTRLDVPRPTQPGELGSLVAAIGPLTQLSVESFAWREHTLGELHALVKSGEQGISIEGIRLAGTAHEARASIDCASLSSPCNMSFELASEDAAATLRDFGFRDEVTARSASLSGGLTWPLQTQRPWLETVRGRVSMRFADGAIRAADLSHGRAFALLTVPALLRESVTDPADRVPAMPAATTLGFSQFAADFELREGNAFTSNLHFDGEAEILMRGRTGLIAQDYDQLGWVLRGEERLPAAVRRLGPTPRIAAAWMALRDLLSRSDDESRAALHLGGQWDAPVVGPVRDGTQMDVE